jgi:hypothetical protein
MTIREYDEHCEKIVSQFLDEHFYKLLPELENFERITDKQYQVKGVDVVINNKDRQVYVDEKAAVKYLKLKTFALELSFLNRFGKLQTGWFLDKKKINDYYLFVWINELTGDKIEDITSIKEVDVALVKKEKLYNYLETLGWTLDKLKVKDKLIREQCNVNMGDIKKYGCKFSYSEQLKEKPINILLPKTSYIELADVFKNIKKHS